MNVSIPTTWRLCHLGDVVDYGKTEKAEPHEIADDAWILELEDIEKDTSRVLARVTFAERKSKSTKNQFDDGDVLYGKLRPYLNKVVIADEPGYCTTEIIPLRLTSHLDNHYLFYWLKHPSFLDYVADVSHGLNMPRLGTAAGKKAPFILAPLAEQKRIADKLEVVLGRVDACRTRLDRVPALLKRFRQSVLAAATSGKLTEEWRGENGVDEEWEESNLGCCGKVGGGLTKNSKRQLLPLQKPYLRVANVQANSLSLSDVSKIGLTEAEHQKTRLQTGDLLIVEGNGSIDQLGRVAIWGSELNDCVHQNHLIRWRTLGPDPRFILYWLLSPRGRDDLMALASTTTGLHTLSISKVSALPINIPTLPEQTEIVRRVEALFAFADRIEARLAAAQATVARHPRHPRQSVPRRTRPPGSG